MQTHPKQQREKEEPAGSSQPKAKLTRQAESADPIKAQICGHKEQPSLTPFKEPRWKGGRD